MSTTTNPTSSIGDLIRKLTAEASLLFNQEIELAKTEMAEKASVAGRNVGAIAVGGAIAFLGALALLAAIVTGLGALLETFLPHEVAVWLAPLLVGTALAFFGYTRIQTALGNLGREGLAPDTPAAEQADQGKDQLNSRAHHGSQQVRAHIEATRQAMDHTMEALQGKFRAGQLLRSGLNLSRSGSGSGAGKFVELARTHPVPAAVIGVGVGMMLRAISNKGDDENRAPQEASSTR